MSNPVPWLRSAWPRVRRWAKYAAIGIGILVLLVLLAYSLLLWHSSRRVEHEIEAIRALNEPTNWDELVRTGLDGHVSGGVRPDVRELSTLYAEALSICADFGKGPVAGLLKKSPRELTPADIQALDHAVDRYQVAWGLLVKASRLNGTAILPEDGVQMTQEALDSTGRLRSAFWLIRTKAYLAAARGQGDDAADICLTGLRCSKAFPGHNLITAMINEGLVALMCTAIERVQSTAPSSAERYDELIRALEGLVNDTSMIRGLCGERVCISHLFETNWCNMPRFWLWPNHAACLGLLRDEIAAARLPFPQSLDRADEVGAPWRSPIGPRYTFSIFARMNADMMPIRFQDAARHQARLRVLLVSLAIRRAKLDGLAPPASLDALAPKYLSKLPTDPFSGAPLRHFVEKDECVVYSVGINRVDDHASEKEVHTPRYSYPEDIVLRFRP